MERFREERAERERQEEALAALREAETREACRRGLELHSGRIRDRVSFFNVLKFEELSLF